MLFLGTSSIYRRTGDQGEGSVQYDGAIATQASRNYFFQRPKTVRYVLSLVPASNHHEMMLYLGAPELPVKAQ